MNLNDRKNVQDSKNAKFEPKKLKKFHSNKKSTKNPRFWSAFVLFANKTLSQAASYLGVH